MFPFSESKEKSPRIGRLSPIDVEIDALDWYYFGKVEMFDTEVKLENEEKPRKIYFYRTLTKYREDEKLIVSTEDFIGNADQIPYTRTEKGKKRLLTIMMLAYVAIELLTIYLSYLFVQAGPNIVYYPQVVNSLEWNFGTIAFLFVALVVIWAYNARYHHYVSDWQIQPLIINAEKSDVEFYILTNSSKLPVSITIQKLLKLNANEIEKFVHAVRLFQENTIRDLTDQNKALIENLNKIDVEGFAIHKKSIEAALATREERFVEKLDTLKWVAMTIVVAVVFGFVVYIAMGGRL
jgi:hypothetical protein